MTRAMSRGPSSGTTVLRASARAAAASGASYAAGEDPYKRPAEDDEADARD